MSKTRLLEDKAYFSLNEVLSVFKMVFALALMITWWIWFSAFQTDGPPGQVNCTFDISENPPYCKTYWDLERQKGVYAMMFVYHGVNLVWYYIAFLVAADGRYEHQSMKMLYPHIISVLFWIVSWVPWLIFKWDYMKSDSRPAPQLLRGVLALSIWML